MSYAKYSGLGGSGGGGGGGTPGGSVNDVQVNNGSGGFTGDNGFTYNGSAVVTTSPLTAANFKESATGNLNVGTGAGNSSNTTNNQTNVGYQAGFSQNVAGIDNTNIGHQAGYQALGTSNTLVGNLAGWNSQGGSCTIVGDTAGDSAGACTTAIGVSAGAGTTGANNTFIGCDANVSSASFSGSIALGKDALATASNQFAVASTITSVVLPGSTSIAKNLVVGGGISNTAFSAGNSSTAITLDFNNGSIQTVTMTGNCTFTLSNPIAGTVYCLTLTQDATGGRTYTWPAAVKWPGGTAPTGSAANKIDIVTLLWDGTNYFGTFNGNY